MTVTIIGCGYVGLTTAVILANCDFEVRAVEVNPERLASIQSGKSFFFEAGVDALLQAGLASGKLSVGNDITSAATASDIIFSCVGTPDNPDGSSNLTYVFDAARAVLPVMNDAALYVQKSTVPVGTGQRIIELLQENSKTNQYVSSPEFLREGTAICDTLYFDRVVAGSENPEASKAVLDIYRQIEQRRDEIAAIAQVEAPQKTVSSSYYQTSLPSAELIKVTANAFLALKISFANSIAKLADQAGADIVQVMDGVGADNRIGRAFLNAGRGYGGGCFPKDVSGLIRSSQDYGISMEIMTAASNVNSSMVHYIISQAAAAFGDSFHNTAVTVLGLSFKPGTSDVRRSPAIALANTLVARGADVRAYDPEAMNEARPELNGHVTLVSSITDALENAACVFVATDWEEFKTFDWGTSHPKLIVDCMNVLDPATIKAAGCEYLGIGRR